MAAPLLLVWSVGTIILTLTATQTDERAAELLSDPTFAVGLTWYTGLVANLNVLAWTVAMVAALAGAWLCGLGGRTSARRFLLEGAAVTLLLLVDALIAGHTIVLPTYTGFTSSFGQSMLALAVGWWLFRQWREIHRTHAYLLAAAIAAMAVSFVVDSSVQPIPGDPLLLVEYGSSFLATLAWATYFVITAQDIARSVFVERRGAEPDAAEILERAVPSVSIAAGRAEPGDAASTT